MDDVKDFVQQQLKDAKVVMFSKSYCPYCAKAKKSLGKYHIPPADYRIIELDKLQDEERASNIQNYMKTLTGASSVPRVFIDGKFIGGGDDTEKLDKSGELKNLLEAAGINASV